MDKQFLLSSYQMGGCIKCFAFYDDCFWRDMKYNGLCLAYDDSMVVKLTYDACVENVHSKFGSKNLYVIAAFILADAAKIWSQKSPQERKERVLEDLAKFFNTDKALKAIDYVDQDWIQEPYSQGAYLGVLPPHVLSTVGDAMHTPHQSVYFAGTELATKFMGYMEGACESAERAVRQMTSVTSKI